MHKLSSQLAGWVLCSVFFLLTGCFAFNQDWTQKPASKTDYVPGQHYQLLTSVFFDEESGDPFLSRKVLGDSTSILDAGTRMRVTTVHYNGDSFEMGFYTTVRAMVVNGPFKGRTFNISHLSDGPSAFIVRNRAILAPIDASTPDLNTNHFAWAASQVVEYRGEYTCDWWRYGAETPKVILPVRFLLRHQQNDLLLKAFHEATTAEGKIYALSALRMLNYRGTSDLAQSLITAHPQLNTYRKGRSLTEPTSLVIARMQDDLETLYPKR